MKKIIYIYIMVNDIFRKSMESQYWSLACLIISLSTILCLGVKMLYINLTNYIHIFHILTKIIFLGKLFVGIFSWNRMRSRLNEIGSRTLLDTSLTSQYVRFCDSSGRKVEKTISMYYSLTNFTKRCRCSKQTIYKIRQR